MLIIKEKILFSLDFLTEVFYLAVVFLLPVFFGFLYPSYNLFELSKLELFKILTLGLAGLTACQLIWYPEVFTSRFSSQKWRVLIKRYLLFPILLIVFLIVSSLASIDPVNSWFGSYFRQQGVVSYLFYFLFFLSAGAHFLFPGRYFISRDTDRELFYRRVGRLMRVITASASIVAIYGILQIMNIDFFVTQEPPYLTYRTLSTFGQPNFLASFLLLSLPVAAYLVYKVKSFWPRFYYFLSLAAQFLCLVFTASRGALLSFFLIGAVVMVYIVARRGLSQKQIVLSVAGLLALLMLSLMMLNYLLPGRLASSFDPKSGSSAARIKFYQSAAAAILKKPILGYGLENAGEAFIYYYESDWGVYGDINSSTDRAHNLVLDILLNSGFIGLLFFSFFYYISFRCGWDNIRRGPDPELMMAFVLAGGAYLFSLLFSFAIVSGEVYFWLFLSVIMVGHIYNSEQLSLAGQAPENSEKKRPIRRAIISAALIGFVSIMVIQEVDTVRADHYFNSFYRSLKKGSNFDFNSAQQVRVLGAPANNQEFYERFFADTLSSHYQFLPDGQEKERMAVELETSLNTLSSVGYENHFSLGKVYSALGDYQDATAEFNLVTRAAPNWPNNYLAKADNYFRSASYTPALVNYRLALINSPELSDQRLNERHRSAVGYFRYLVYVGLAETYLAQKRYPAALENYHEAYGSYPWDFTLYKKMADVAYLQGDFTSAINYSLAGFKRNPKDYIWPLSLAILYQNVGNRQAAEQYFLAAWDLAPDNHDLQEFKNTYFH